MSAIERLEAAALKRLWRVRWSSEPWIDGLTTLRCELTTFKGAVIGFFSVHFGRGSEDRARTLCARMLLRAMDAAGVLG